MFEKLASKKSTRVHVTIEQSLKERLDLIAEKLPEGTVFPYQKMLAEHLLSLVNKAEKQLEKTGADPESQVSDHREKNTSAHQHESRGQE